VRAAALALAALALTACESSQEKSAKLEKVAKREAAAAKHRNTSLSIVHESTKVKVSATAILHGAEGAAAVVTLRNLSGAALRDVPIQISVRNTAGATVYANDAPSLAAALVSVPLLPAHATTSWVDDQVQATGVPASVSAKVGEGEAARAPIPQLSVQGTRLSDESGEPQAEGSVLNRSAAGLHEVVVYAVARRAGRIVAAGRAVLPQAPAGASTRFQLYFIGDPRGAQLQFSAVDGAA